MDGQIIIGFSGKKQSGKTTAVGHFVQRYAALNPCVVSFADPLKRIVIECFCPNEWGLHVPDLDGEEVKQRVTPCGKTVRELLQVVGTDMFRGLWGRVWLNTMEYELLHAGKLVVVPDVRFPNEVQFIQERGGHVVRLLRAPYAQDQHASETALDETGLDIVAFCHSE